MSRVFEKISEKQFKIDFNNLDVEYNDIILPIRKTSFAAGYDFIANTDIEIKPNEIVKIPTGIKVKLNEDEFLGIYVRSSMGFKYNVRMCNQVGIIDFDYYNNEDNEGHMWICLQNQGEKNYTIKKGDGYAQGIFQKYFKVDNDDANNIRKGGLGSTNKGDNDKDE